MIHARMLIRREKSGVQERKRIDADLRLSGVGHYPLLLYTGLARRFVIVGACPCGRPGAGRDSYHAVRAYKGLSPPWKT